MEWKVAILGGGRIGEALLSGLLSSGWRDASEIVVSDRRAERVAELAERYAAAATSSNVDAVSGARARRPRRQPAGPGRTPRRSRQPADPAQTVVSVAAATPTTHVKGRIADGVPSCVRCRPRPRVEPREVVTSPDGMTIAAIREVEQAGVRAAFLNRDPGGDGPRPGAGRGLTMARTLLDKVWERHVVRREDGRPDLLYVDLHLVHEVTSPQAFEGLRLAGRRVRRPDLTLATMDHNVATGDDTPVDPLSEQQLETLRRNCKEFGVPLHATGSGREGIVHVIGPEQGLTQPGLVIVCGDSHTSTHGAFGALAFGVGTSEVEHVLATQTLAQWKPRSLRITFTGEPHNGVAAKDYVLAAIGRIGVDGGVGHVIEYAGPAIEALSLEGRMTICNMSIEAGARAGMVAPDETTSAYLRERGVAEWPEWHDLRSDDNAVFDCEVAIDVSEIRPQVTWGTNPGMVVSIDDAVPEPADEAAERALAYMGLKPGTPVREIAVDRVFIGSCTNSRIEDLRVAAAIVRGRRVHPTVRAMVVPGSALVKAQAEQEGLDRIFSEAGFEWRRAGCSMCLGMNPDVLAAGERCASTSNRNFEGRQGAGGRTHLVSPAIAAATALAGHFAEP